MTLTGAERIDVWDSNIQSLPVLIAVFVADDDRICLGRELDESAFPSDLRRNGGREGSAAEYFNYAADALRGCKRRTPDVSSLFK